MKNILVVGGAGFIGSHIVRRLMRIDSIKQIVVYDNFSSGHANVILHPNVVVIKGDARDYDFLRVTMKKMEIDVVIHLAANPDIARAATEPTIDFDQGTVLTKNVVEAMRVNDVKRLIYFSGSGVYGDCGDRYCHESMSCEPISMYGASKLASEAMILAYASMFGISPVILRPANIVGSRQTHGVGFDFIRRLKESPSSLRILGDGLQSKSYIHVNDVVNAVDMFLIKEQISGVFNIATTDHLTVTEIAEMAVRVMGIENVIFEYTGGRGGWKGDVPVVRLNCAKLRSVGWCEYRDSRGAMMDALISFKNDQQ